jgi:hypothetical protein
MSTEFCSATLLLLCTLCKKPLLIDKCGVGDASVIDIMNKGGEHNNCVSGSDVMP